MSINNLEKFEHYLAGMNIVPKQQIPFYCIWIKEFLNLELRIPELSDQDKIISWISKVSRYDSIGEWQVKQAEEAVKIYLEWRLTDGFEKFSDTRLNDNLHQMTVAEVLNKTKDLIRLRHYSYRTEGTYLDWINRYVKYGRDHKASLRSPSMLNAYLTYLATERKVAKATQNQAFNALLFLFREVLKIDVSNMGKVVRAKRGPKLPVVLTEDEVRRLFDNTSKTSAIMLKIVYGGGLRVSELTRLRVQDIDFQQRLLHIRAGKGDVDRTTLLPLTLVKALKAHVEAVKAIYDDDLAKGFGEVYYRRRWRVNTQRLHDNGIGSMYFRLEIYRLTREVQKSDAIISATKRFRMRCLRRLRKPVFRNRLQYIPYDTVSQLIC